MINILNSWNEVGQAVHALARAGLPGDAGLVKSWDLHAIKNLLPFLESSNPSILDMGAGGSLVLRFLAAIGMKNLSGVDLQISLRDRLRQLKRMIQGRTLRPPWQLYRRDLTHTRFPKSSFDLLTCVSVMEHFTRLVSSDKVSHSTRRRRRRDFVPVSRPPHEATRAHLAVGTAPDRRLGRIGP